MNRCDECKHRESCVCVPYGCESFEIDLSEHDKQIRAEFIDEFTSNCIEEIEEIRAWYDKQYKEQEGIPCIQICTVLEDFNNFIEWLKEQK